MSCEDCMAGEGHMQWRDGVEFASASIHSRRAQQRLIRLPCEGCMAGEIERPHKGLHTDCYLRQGDRKIYMHPENLS